MMPRITYTTRSHICEYCEYIYAYGNEIKKTNTQKKIPLH